MNYPLTEYKTFVFDCDGVILNSNRVKTEAFYKAALPFGEKAASLLVDYHVNNGGISRYKKFEWFLSKIKGEIDPELLKLLLENYATFVSEGLNSCDLVSGLAEFREATGDANWLIVSGGDQQELRSVFEKRNISDFFDGGIFGSPDTKEVILRRELQRFNIELPALFLGDSRYDHEAARDSNIDFLFLSYWTEFKGWKEYCDENSIRSLDKFPNKEFHE